MTETLMTKREWLATQMGEDGKPLAIAGARGRFSQAAQKALDEAIAKGMTFAEPVKPEPKAKAPKADKVVVEKPKPVKVEGEYDAKAVRSWAAQTGQKVGERGRIPAEVINAYLAANGNSPKPRVTVVVTPPREKIRPETVGYGFARRKPEDGKHISEPLLTLGKCGVCNDGIAFCKCKTGPMGKPWMGNGKAEPLLLVKPV